MDNFIKQNWLKIIAIVFLIGALFSNPYSYYQLLRWVVIIAAVYTAYVAYKNKKNNEVWIFSVMAVLFNPIIPFYLQRSTWQLIDIVSAVLFLIFLFLKYDKQN